MLGFFVYALFFLFLFFHHEVVVTHVSSFSQLVKCFRPWDRCRAGLLSDEQAEAVGPRIPAGRMGTPQVRHHQRDV